MSGNLKQSNVPSIVAYSTSDYDFLKFAIKCPCSPRWTGSISLSLLLKLRQGCPSPLGED